MLQRGSHCLRGEQTDFKLQMSLQPVDQKPHSQKDRKDEKAEGYVPDERTR